MARIPNPEIGFLPCFCCGTRASLRKDRAGLLYYNCPRCGGPLNGHGITWQERCLNDATLYGEDGQPVVKQPIKADPPVDKSAPLVDPSATKTPEKKPESKPEASTWGFRL